MSVAVVLFTSDLRVHDQPVLRAALGGADEVVPLFVLDPGVHKAGFDAPNRRAFLADCLASLDEGLRRRGGRLIIRTGDAGAQVRAVVGETGARQVHVAGGVSGFAAHREEALRAELAEAGATLVVHDAVVTAVPPGQLTPAGKDHFAVFTPYYRRWDETPLRQVMRPPRTVCVPAIPSDPLPDRAAVDGVSPGLARGGEDEARSRLTAWLATGIEGYQALHDDLPADATSRLSPHLHFGCVSPVELVHRARDKGGTGADAFVRQLAWRDFHYQVLAARHRASWSDYRSRGDDWRADSGEISAWRNGRTGYPVVDAAMRQLLHEGWMHNRARLLAASFLTKTLYVDWRVGARHFLDLLVDGDIANNQLNWQWVAGTGTDTRPHRVLNPLTQARRFDPHGDYVRRWIPELAGLSGPVIHQPWRLDPEERAGLGYPEPIVDLSEGRARFARARGLGG